jgi:two-component system, NtrC family, nitrogen regulation response regulator GlnG
MCESAHPFGKPATRVTHEPQHTVDAGQLPGPTQARPVALKVVVVAGTDQGREVPFEGLIEVGADPACGLCLSDRSVSRRHLSLEQSQGRLKVKDLGSRNGTHLGGARIQEAEIPLGTVLKLGDTSIAVQPRWYLRETVPSSAREFGELYGESYAMRDLFSIFERVAGQQVTVLLEGESGTGKELAARSLHMASPRAAGPYEVFDCASVPAELSESELFGHKKGAFSGATADRLGAFARADGGTLCLDELGELPIDLQPKLLRALETGEVRPVGSDTVSKIDVRVLAATNRDLHAEVKRGAFRADLLYRLEVVKVRLPPLRQRPEDIAGLANRILSGQLPPQDRVAGENLARLLSYSWPGNVRELRNVLTRAVSLSRAAGEPAVPFEKLVLNLGPASSTPATIGFEFPGVARPLAYKEARGQLLESFERAYVLALLDRHKGNVMRAADAAGLSRKHLYELMRKVEGVAEDP